MDKKDYLLLWIVGAFCVFVIFVGFSGANGAMPNDPSVGLILRCDDIGMTHTVNVAIQRVIESGLPVSTSVMFVCPWYQEAVDILKAHPEVSVGIHLTLNAEWKNFRWGPVVGVCAAPSLVDTCGYFFPSRASFEGNHPKIDEIEKELRAQIERGIASGLKIDYVDYHMGTAVSKPEYRRIVEKLAAEYRLGISRYFGEVDAPSIYALNPSVKPDSLVAIVKRLPTGRLNLLVFHIGLENTEMDAMIDMNSFGLSNMSRHRNGELNALMSTDFRNILWTGKYHLMTYRDVIRKVGLVNMKSPE
ncbi:MAG: hypothetical protein COT43_09150 [Candidatus Marinimicrobia bacterium CG08_land_8_20_14_0_20_45_22]|nr:MAG: hypothetical protein COT43_09150 [Candidatus Marinimicrobia bacterium CG08_land_8_20_14_0_20_45_22]